MIEIPDISHLTAKQQNFVQAKAEGQTDIKAYQSAGYSQTASHAEQIVKAGKVKRNAHVSTILTAIQLRKSEIMDLSIETHVKELSELALQAKGLKQINAAVRAVELKGKVAGHYVERIRQEPVPQVADAFQVMITEISQTLGDKAAREYAKQKGVEWLPVRDTDDSTTDKADEA